MCEVAVIRSRGNAAKLVLAAEGHRASTLLRAKGEAQAKTLLATCEAAAVKPSALRSAKRCGPWTTLRLCGPNTKFGHQGP